MNPIFIARKSVLPLSLNVESRCPAIHTSPDVNSSMPGRQLRSVVLPHPDGPITATISPLRASRSKPRSAWTAPPPLSYVFTRRRATTIPSSTRGAFAGATVGGGAAAGEAAQGVAEEDARRGQGQRGRVEVVPGREGGGGESRGDGGWDRNRQALDWQAKRPGRDEGAEERRARHEPDRREAEHQAAKVRRGPLRRGQHDPQVLPLVERPVDREDPEREGQRLRDGRHADQTPLIAARARRQDPDDGEQPHEQDAPVPPDADEVEARHEARVPAAVRSESHAGGDSAEARRDMPLDFHPR